MKNVLLQAAIEYVKSGWSVIPLGADKKPLVKWKEFQQRHPTVAELNAWWGQWPDANIAILTGRVSGFVVADVDTSKGGDVEAWRELHPTTMEVKTPSGGRHFYYLHPGEGVVRNSVDTVAPKVDIRGDGGYVMAPPSVRADGRGYAWHGSFRRMPIWEDQLPTEEALRADITGNTEHWLADALENGVESGARNDMCARLAGYLLKKKLPVDVVIGQLLAWNRLNRPPMPDAEVKTTVKSVQQTDRDRRDPTASLNETTGPYDVISLSKYIGKHGGKPVTWLVKDWLPAQTVGMVVAPPGSYKTWLLQDLAVSVATGLPFLGQFEVQKQGPVLFMQQEDWHGQIAMRFSLIVARKAGLRLPWMKGDTMHVDAPPAVPIFLHEHRSFRFDNAEVVQEWINVLKKLKPALVILDPLYSAGGVDDFMAGTATDMFLFKKLRDSLGITFLIAHHTRKSARGKDNGSKPNGDEAAEREDVWGSQFLNAWMETGWQIRKREEPGTASISRHFKVQGEAKRGVLAFTIDTTMNPGRYEVGIREIQPGDKERGEVDLVELLDKLGPQTVPQLVGKTGLNRATLYRRIDVLVKANTIHKEGSKYAVTEGLEVGTK